MIDAYTPNLPDSHNNEVPIRSSKSKRTIIALFTVLLLVGIIAATRLLGGSGGGSLVVSSNTTNAIVRISAYPDLQPKVAKITNKEYRPNQTINLPAGTYSVRVGDGDRLAAKTVEIKNGQQSLLSINPLPKLSQLEPVGSVNANQFAAGNKQLFYTDSQSNNLYGIGTANEATLLSQLALTDVQWTKSSFGVAQDSVGTLYSVANGSVKPINGLPAINGDNPASFALAPNNDIYLAYSKDVYVGRVGSSFKRIHSSGSSPVNLAASNNSLAVIAGVNDLDIANSVTLINKNGSSLKKSNFGANIVWSPSGKYFFANSRGPDQIYDTAFHIHRSVPSNLPQFVVWRDDQTLYYAENDLLWEYSLSTSQAKVVAATNNAQSIAGLKVSDDGNYIYLSVQSSSGDGVYYSLYRYGLKNQPISEAATNLQTHLPWLTDGCFLGLINFTRPTVTVTQANDFSGCINVARDFVETKGLNANSFNYKITDTLPSTPSR